MINLKKIFMLVLIMFIFLTFSFKSNAKVSAPDTDVSDYRKFTSFQMSSGKLLKNYTNQEIKDHMKKCNKRKFTGWRISYMNKHVRCNFTSKTLLSIYNNGNSPITYKLSETQNSMYKVSLSTTGSLGGSVKGDIKKFKGGLDAKVGIESSITKTIEVKTAESLEILVDPGTRATIYLKGSGYLTTGCAVLYGCWIRDLVGCFEFFEIVDCYPKIVKEKI